MNPGPHVNPYAPPTAEADFDLAQALSTPFTAPLATLWERWLGAFLDNIFAVLGMLPGLVLAFRARGSEEWKLLLTFVGLIAVFVLQAYLITVSGQSLGKKLVHTKIVKQDGSRPGFVHGVLLRSWLVYMMTAIPVVGSLVGLVDVLLIFRADRRCLHDLLAGTSVVRSL